MLGTGHADFHLFFCLQSQKQNLDITRQAKFAATPSLALFVNLKNVVCKIGEDAEVLMSLYDPVECRFIRYDVVLLPVFQKHQRALLPREPPGRLAARPHPGAGAVAVSARGSGRCRPLVGLVCTLLFA